MITLDRKPCLAMPGITKIVLSDGAFPEESYVYMDRDDAPKAKDAVWIEISNPSYDSDATTDTEDPEYDPQKSERYQYRNWFYVHDVLTNNFPNLTDDYSDKPQVCKVVLYELRETNRELGFSTHFNTFSAAKYLILKYNEALTTEASKNPINSWSEIADLLEVRSRLDTDELDPEYPIHIPKFLLWANLNAQQALDDLLQNYQTRVIEKPLIIPDDEDASEDIQALSDTTDVLSNTCWKARRPIQFDADLTYTSLLWPDEVYPQQDSVTFTKYVLYRTYQSFFSASAEDQTVPSPTSPDNNSLVFSLEPYLEYPTGSVPNNDTLSDYLESTNINHDVRFSFTVQETNPVWMEERDWTRIVFQWTNNPNNSIFGILIEHDDRKQKLMLAAPRDSKELLYCDVNTFGGDSVGATNIYSITDDAEIGDWTIPIDPTIYQTSQIRAVIALVNTTFTFVHFEPARLFRVLYSGDRVTQITHNYGSIPTIPIIDLFPNLDLTPEPPTDVFKYEHVDTTLTGNPALVTFSIADFPNGAHSLFTYNTPFPKVVLAFDMIVDQTAVEEYLALMYVNDNYPILVETLAERWISQYGTIKIAYRPSVNPQLMDLVRVHPLTSASGLFGNSIDPVVDEDSFETFRGIVGSSFPLSVSGAAPTNPMESGDPGFPTNTELRYPSYDLPYRLWQYFYYDVFVQTTGSIDITTVPYP